MESRESVKGFGQREVDSRLVTLELWLSFDLCKTSRVQFLHAIPLCRSGRRVGSTESYSSHPKTSLWGLRILTEPVEKQALPLLLDSHGAGWGLQAFWILWVAQSWQGCTGSFTVVV